MPGFGPVGSLPIGASSLTPPATTTYAQSEPWLPIWRVQYTIRPTAPGQGFPRSTIRKKTVLYNIRHKWSGPYISAGALQLPNRQIAQARVRYIQTYKKWHKPWVPPTRYAGRRLRTKYPAFVRFSQVVREVLTDSIGTVRVSQVCREVLRSTSLNPSFRRCVWIME